MTQLRRAAASIYADNMDELDRAKALVQAAVDGMRLLDFEDQPEVLEHLDDAMVVVLNAIEDAPDEAEIDAYEQLGDFERERA